MTSSTEQGLFERITAISSGRINGDAYIISGLALNRICAEHEQQLADAESLREEHQQQCAQNIKSLSAKLAEAQAEAARQEKDYITAATRASFLDIEVQQLTDQLAEAGQQVNILQKAALAVIRFARERGDFPVKQQGSKLCKYDMQKAFEALEDAFTAPLPEKNPKPFTIDGKDPAEFFDELDNKPEKNGS